MDLFLVFSGPTSLHTAGHGVRQVSPHAFQQVDGQLCQRGGGGIC